MTCNTATTGSARSSTGNLFCQLRQLAVQVESGVDSLHTELASNRVRDGDIVENTKAVNFLLHTKKDIVDLRSNVINSLMEFSQENAKIDKICELMNHVLAVHSERLDKVESHFQTYGYQKPVPTSKTNTENHVAAASTGKCGSSDANSAAYDESEGSDNRDVGELTYDSKGACPSTPTDACEKPVVYNGMRTPKLEDLYSNLSEEMISIIKQAGRNTLHNEAPLKQNTTLKAYSNNTLIIKTPEPPVLLSGIFTLNDKSQFSSKNDTDQFSSLKSHNSTPTTPGMNISNFSRKDTNGTGRRDRQMTNVSVCQVKVPVKTPEMPTLLMPRFHLSSALNVAQADTGKSAISFFQTPPTPELKMCQFRNKDLAKCLNEVNKNANTSQTADLSMPEAPKLFSVASMNKNAHTSQTADLSMPEAPKLFSVASMLTPEAPRLYSATGLSTPEVPKLLTRSHHFNHYLERKWDA